MKKLEKFSVSFSAIMLMTNNIVYAATESAEEGIPSKYIFIGIAAVVIILLLFLGYKMDAKGEEITVPKSSKKNNKKTLHSEQAYEEDYIDYEVDNDINTDELMDSTEYEDDEESLFSTFENTTKDDMFSSMPNTINESDDSNNDSESNYNIEDEEEMGEEFDTSIIDSIDDEDDIKAEPKSFDETMVFNNSNANVSNTNIENEIDTIEEKDTFIEELNKFEEPESTFEDFSVASDEFSNNYDNVEQPKKTVKKYTKSKTPKEVVVEKKVEYIPADENFLKEMEKTLEKNKEERNIKVSPVEKTTTVKKITTRKKKS